MKRACLVVLPGIVSMVRKYERDAKIERGFSSKFQTEP